MKSCSRCSSTLLAMEDPESDGKSLELHLQQQALARHNMRSCEGLTVSMCSRATRSGISTSCKGMETISVHSTILIYNNIEHTSVKIVLVEVLCAFKTALR
jgi:hypothetical protein